MAMSWHMMLEFEPPLMACICSSANYSVEALRKAGECVIAIPTRMLAPKVVKVGNTSGQDLDKFMTFGLTASPASEVAAPLVKECFANLECKCVDRRMIEKYNMFILEIVAAWIDPTQRNPKTIHHHGYGTFAVDGPLIKLSSRKP
jgi:flavin reductase (DIM6/NTAB) family NADH-FMN oxidoreductase RutF